MNKFRWSNARLIMRREIRDQLRDRRTLFMIAVLPLLLYPLMGMSFMQVTQFLQKTPSKVLVVIEGELPDDPPLIEDSQFVGLNSEESRLIDLEVQQIDLPDDFEDVASRMIQNKMYDAVLCVPLIDSLNDSESSEPDEDGEGAEEASANVNADTNALVEKQPKQPQLFFDAARDSSRIAKERLTKPLTAWQTSVRRAGAKPETPVEPVASAEPMTITASNLAKPKVLKAIIWAKILPFVALIWALTGAFYPAVDLCAGEKERGTLETLLSSPAERSEIVTGKLLTIMLFSLATAVLNLLCMMGTASFAIQRIQSLAPAATVGHLGMPPLGACMWVLLALIPISALFSALALALATMARSTKEGQYYLMPLLLICMPLMLLAVFPSSRLNLGSSIVPVTGLLLLLRTLMEGDFKEALIYVVPVGLTTAACVVLSVRWAIDQFNNESVLFRESERFDLGLWLVQLVRDRAPTPSVAAGILCGILVLIIRFFAGMSLPTPQSWFGFGQVTAITMIAFVASPALLMAAMLTTKPRETLLLVKPTNWLSIPAAIALAVCLHPIALGMSMVLRTVYPVDEAALAPLARIFEQAPSMTSIILLLAVLPAICEELAFRGFILSGLRHMGHKWRAIFFSSLFFGIAHGILQQSIMAMVFGLVMGYIAVHSRSLFPCIAFHATHNSLSFACTQWLPDLAKRLPNSPWLLLPIETASEIAPVLYCYGPFVMLCGFILASGLLRWFQQLPYQPTKEEQFVATLKRQDRLPSAGEPALAAN